MLRATFFRVPAVVLSLAVIGAMPVAAAPSHQPSPKAGLKASPGPHYARPPGYKPAGTLGPQPPDRSNLSYHGGAVMRASKAYLTFWGTEWQNGFTSGGYTNIQIMQYIQAFFGNVGGSNWLDSVTQYSGLANPVNQLAGSWVDASPVPASPTRSDIGGEAMKAWGQHFPNAGNLTGVYFVFTPPGKTERGFPTSFCAYHDSLPITTDVWLAYVGMPFLPDAGATKCGMNWVNSGQNDPIGHGYLDGFSILGGHEYGEALTDPLVNAWQDNSLQENGDKCIADQFATYGNIALGSGYYAVQGLWSNADSACSLGGKYNPIAPSRILDTRSGIGGRSTPIGAGETFYLQVTGRAGVPTSLVSAVVLNVTITNPTAPSYLTVYPAGTPRPITSNINYVANQTIPNLVTVGIGSGGQVAFFNAAGTTNLLADVQGWVSLPGPSSTAGLYQPLSTRRILDTRDGTGGYFTPFSPQETRVLQIAGVGGVPASGVSAVVLNVVAANQTAAGYLIIWPDGSPQPTASSLNFLANQTAVNRVIVKVSNGWIDIYNAFGSVNVIADVNGYFGTSGSSEFVPLNPARVFDSRQSYPFSPGETRTILITDQGGVPKAYGATSPTAVVINVTVTNEAGAGYLVIWPEASGMPSPASDNNFYANTTEANLDVVQLLGTGKLLVFNGSGGSAHVIIDVVGYYLQRVPVF